MLQSGDELISKQSLISTIGIKHANHFLNFALYMII